MKSVLFPFLAILALSLAPLRAADEPRLTALQAADDERVAATMAGDGPRLTAIYSDDLRYAHSSGAVDTKASYIEALTTGRTKYVAWQYQERNFTFPAPGIALMTGRTRVKVAKADGTVEMVLAFLGVWREEKGQWHFLAWQSGKLPEPTPAAK
ncbi:MAG: nuclear transport factor 2 family protein [Chthoniobacter sp.]|nr:nuclear transport factor 2 family protein [Chthoniobacter sp.]